MQDYKTMIAMCEEQEEKFQFERFSRKDALHIGLKLIENAEKQQQPVAVEIVVNGLTEFRFFMDGAKPESELWLARKRNAVELTEGSSLKMFAEMESAGQTFADRKLCGDDYAAGGGFPITLRGTGVVGSICVSGFDDHLDDHQLVINTLAEYLA